jgi:hypothetical protein
MKKLIVLFAPLVLPIALFSQNTFEFWLEYPERKRSNHAIEKEDGSFIAVVSERSGTDYAPSEPTKAYLLLINPVGDTATRHYHLQDTTFSFNGIYKSYNEGYLITGHATRPDTDELYLLLMEVDANLDPVWIKYHDFSDYYSLGVKRVFMLNGSYLLAGDICYFHALEECLFLFILINLVILRAITYIQIIQPVFQSLC